MLILGCVAAGLYLLLLLLKLYLSLRYAAKLAVLEQTLPAHSLEDMTIMQPILSGDPLLETCLRHNLELFPEVPFIFLVDQDDREGQSICQRLAREFPVMIVDCPPVAQRVNPKVFKLNYGLPYVKTPLLAILDDDTRLSQNSLSVARAHLHQVALYTGLPYYQAGKTFWSRLLTQFVNDNSVLTYLPLLNMYPAFSLNGMFYVLSRETLHNIGGFAAIQHQLTDDYALAKGLRQHQGLIRQGLSTQAVQTTVHDLRHYVSIMHRWFLFAYLQMRDQSAGLKIWLFLFLVLPSFLFVIALMGLVASKPGLVMLVVFIFVRFYLLQYAQKHFLPQSPASSLWMSFLVACFQPLHGLHAFLYRRITWRKRCIEVYADGHFSYQD